MKSNISFLVFHIEISNLMKFLYLPPRPQVQLGAIGLGGCQQRAIAAAIQRAHGVLFGFTRAIHGANDARVEIQRGDGRIVDDNQRLLHGQLMQEFLDLKMDQS